MPTTFNSIGIWYWGKRRIHCIDGICELCKSAADLKSYDTTLYFVVFHIPLIPLGKRRVFQECSVCRKHQSMKLSQWQEMKEKNISETLQLLRQDHEDPEAVIEALGTVTSFQDEELFLKVAENIAGPLTHNADVQSALGAAYLYFARLDEAERAVRTALAVRDDSELREQLAVILLKQSRPAEAEESLQHILDNPNSENAGFLILLAEGYQGIGDHHRALVLYDQAASAYPGFLTDATFKKQRKLAEKHRESGKPIRTATLTSPKSAGYTEGGKSAFLAKLVGPALFLVALSVYLIVAFLGGQAREVVLVNGLNRTYEVVVNGEQYPLPPHGLRRIEVDEGDVRFHVDEEGIKIPQETVSIKTSFWIRPFLSPTFVINPDRVAVLSWEEQSYAENPNDAPDGKNEFHLGEAVYRFNGVDYVFAPFPREIKMGSRSSVVTKSRVGVFDSRQFGPELLLPIVLSQTNKQTAMQYAEKMLAYNPDDEILLYGLQMITGPDEYIDIVRKRLSDRPVRVNWHRVYQARMESTHPNHDLHAEYRDYLATDPGDVELSYLLSRVTLDEDESERLLQQSIQGKKPSAFGYNGLAYSRLTMGQFAEALSLVQRAIAIQPESLTFKKIHRDVLLALGKYDELLVPQERELREKLDFRVVFQDVQLYMLKGDQQGAQRRIEEFCDMIRGRFGQEFVTSVKPALTATIDYCQGDANAYASALAAGATGIDGFAAAFAAGNLEEAAQAMRPETDDSLQQESDESELATRHLLLYLAGQSVGKADFTKRHLDEAIQALKNGGEEDRIIAQILSQEGSSEPKHLLRQAFMPAKKRIVLAALGTRFPADREVYFELARKLNYEPVVPYLFLKKYLSEKPGQE